MIDFAAILKSAPNGVLATADGNKVQTRVFQYLFTGGGGAGSRQVYFSTNTQKPVYDQLQANPHVSFCTFTQDFNPVLSVNGKAVFTENPALKARALDENPLLKGIYKTPENPVFKIFYIDVEEIKTFSHSEGEKTWKM